MTSSEPLPAPEVLAHGHLHPAMLFLRFLEGLRAALLPALVALVTRESWFAVVAILVFLLTLISAVVRYATFEYRLDVEELVTREGILNRQERRIPVNRIQDLSFEQSLLRRALGLVVVSVETASGKGAEARLDSLARRDAERMREALYRARGVSPKTAAEPADERVLWRAPGTEILLLGISTQRVGAIVAAGFGVLELLRELKLVDRVSGVMQGVTRSLGGLSPTLQVMLVGVGLGLVLLLGTVVAVGGAFLLFHGFVLTLRDEVLVRRFGLFTRHVHALPRKKIQRVVLEQSWLRVLLGRCVVKADSAGGGEAEAEKQKSGTDVLAPLLPFGDGLRLAGWALPGFAAREPEWRPVSPRAIARMTVIGSFAAVVLFLGLVPRIGWLALGTLAFVPLAALAGFLTWRRAGWAVPDGHVALRWGMLGRGIALVPARKIQAVVLRAGPLDRLLGMARIVVYVAGGSPSTLAHLVRADAEHLLALLGTAAARARFVW